MSQELTHYGGTPGLPSRHFEGIGRADRKVAEYFQYFYLASRTAISMGRLTRHKTSSHLYLHSQRGYQQIPFPNCAQITIHSNQSKGYIIPLYRIAGYGAIYSLFHIPAIPIPLLATYTFYTSYIPFPFLFLFLFLFPYSYSLYQLSYSIPLPLM